MEMIKTVLTCFSVFLLVASVGSAASVSRSVNPLTVSPGGTVEVTLTVDTSGALDYYAIDDIFPAGFIVDDPGVGATEHKGHWKYVVIEDAVDTVYRYTLKAPDSIGDYSFTGEYMFGGMQDTADIAGTSTLAVSATGSSAGDSSNDIMPADNPIMTYLPILAIVVIFLFLGFFYMKSKKR